MKKINISLLGIYTKFYYDATPSGRLVFDRKDRLKISVDDISYYDEYGWTPVKDVWYRFYGIGYSYRPPALYKEVFEVPYMNKGGKIEKTLRIFEHIHSYLQTNKDIGIRGKPARLEQAMINKTYDFVVYFLRQDGNLSHSWAMINMSLGCEKQFNMLLRYLSYTSQFILSEYVIGQAIGVIFYIKCNCSVVFKNVDADFFADFVDKILEKRQMISILSSIYSARTWPGPIFNNGFSHLNEYHSAIRYRRQDKKFNTLMFCVCEFAKRLNLTIQERSLYPIAKYRGLWYMKCTGLLQRWCKLIETEFPEQYETLRAMFAEFSDEMSEGKTYIPLFDNTISEFEMRKEAKALRYSNPYFFLSLIVQDIVIDNNQVCYQGEWYRYKPKTNTLKGKTIVQLPSTSDFLQRYIETDYASRVFLLDMDLVCSYVFTVHKEIALPVYFFYFSKNP